MVVELVVEVIKSCVSLEGVYKGTTVSYRELGVLSDRGTIR